MKRMIKYIAMSLILLLLLVTSMTACTPTEEKPEGENEPAVTEPASGGGVPNQDENDDVLPDDGFQGGDIILIG